MSAHSSPKNQGRKRFVGTGEKEPTDGTENWDSDKTPETFDELKRRVEAYKREQNLKGKTKTDPEFKKGYAELLRDVELLKKAQKLKELSSNKDGQTSSSIPPKPATAQGPRNPQIPAKTSSNNDSFPNYFYWIAVIVALFVLIRVFVIDSQSNETAELETPEEKFEKLLSKLEKDSYTQPERITKILSFAISLALFEEDSLSPGVILLLAMENKTKRMDKASSQLSKLVSEIFGEREGAAVNCKELPANVSLAKLLLSERIERLANDRHSVVIENVDHLKADVVAALQPYFDDQNAPIKEVVYFLTAFTKAEFQLEENPKNVREFAINHFDEMWADHPREYRDAMYSRILNYVLLIS